MEFPRLTRIAMELVTRRRRPRVLDYATPEPRLTWRQRVELWRQEWDAAGDARWLVLGVLGLGLIIAGPLFLGRWWGELVGMCGAVMLGLAIDPCRRDEPW